MKDIETHIKDAVAAEIAKISEKITSQMIEELDDLVDDSLIEAVTYNVLAKLQPLIDLLSEPAKAFDEKLSYLETCVKELEG